MASANLNNEQSRLDALCALDVLDTAPEPRFDRLTRLAAKAFHAPIALISLVDQDRQWFKSRYGLEARETARSVAFCSDVVAMRDTLVVEDAARDFRFHANPLVTGAPFIRFYAGQPVYSDGQAVGTLCVIDQVPRKFGEDDRQSLRDLALLVEAELDHGRADAARRGAEQALRALNLDLEQTIAARTADLHDKLALLSRESARREASEASLRQSEQWNRSIITASHAGFIASGPDGRIIEWNPSAERILGWPRADALGQRIADLVIPPELRAAHERGMQRFLDTGTGAVIDRRVELPALTASGRRITVEMTISTYEWQGQRCFGAFLNDITERVRTQQQLEEKQELLDAVLESIDIGVVACDADGRLTLFNRSARAMLGQGMQDGQAALRRPDGKAVLPPHEAPLARALRGETLRDESLLVTPDTGDTRRVLASGRPLRGASGQALGAVIAMKDITELSASRRLLAASERRLRAVTENLPAMLGKVDASGKFEYLNSKALKGLGRHADELLGHPVETAYTPEEFATLIPYIDRVGTGERVFFEYVNRTAGGDLHSQCCFVPQRLADGSPDGFFAMAFDITARKQGEQRLAESEDRLRTITDHLPALIAQLDVHGRYRFANAAHRSWLGKDPEAILGKTMTEAFGADYFGAQAEALDQAWHGRVAQCEHEITRKNLTRGVHTTFLPRKRDGIVIGVYVLTTDATAARAHARHLHMLAHTDPLTGLPNRRHFDSALHSGARKARHADRQLGLLFLDVDHFKGINDLHGHAVGDQVLVEFARRLRHCVRASDLVARLAGDEFTIVLHEVRSRSDVENVARKVLTAMREPFALPECTLQVGTTIGAALAADPHTDPGLLVEAADSAMYAAKVAGRSTFAFRCAARQAGAA